MKLQQSYISLNLDFESMSNTAKIELQHVIVMSVTNSILKSISPLADGIGFGTNIKGSTMDKTYDMSLTNPRG